MPRRHGHIARELEELVEDTFSILKRMGGKVRIIEYPTHSARAIDLVSIDQTGDKRIFARVIYDASELNRSDAAELKASAIMYRASPIIVSKYINGMEAEEDVVYEKYGVKALGTDALKAVIYRNEKIYIHHSRGSYVVRIDPKRMKKRREELGLSLGEIASMIGVSRKAVYEYEKGRMNLTVEKAMKLVEILGEDILEPINVFDRNVEIEDESMLKRTDTKIESMILRELESRGYKVYHLKKTPIDLVAKKGDRNVISIVVKHFLSEKKFRQKVNEAEKIIEVTYSRSFTIRDERDLSELREEV